MEWVKDTKPELLQGVSDKSYGQDYNETLLSDLSL